MKSLKSDKSCEFGGVEAPNSLEIAYSVALRAILASETSHLPFKTNRSLAQN